MRGFCLVALILNFLISSISVAFPRIAFALSDCAQSGIAYSPNFFPQGISSGTINFKITDDETLNNLKNSTVALKVGWGANVGLARVPGEEIVTVGIPADDITTGYPFSLTLKEWGNLDQGKHSGRLVYSPNSISQTQKYVDLCQVDYQVGSTDACKITTTNIPSSIPPASKLSISFFGDAKRSYDLVYEEINGATSNFTIAKTTTDDFGNGSFNDFVVNGKNEDRIKLTIFQTGMKVGYKGCSQTISLSIKAPPPPAPVNLPTVGSATQQPPGTANIPAPCSGNSCSKSAGVICDTNTGKPDDKGSGILTAIGCVPTDPLALVNALLRFSVGIGGGIALLLIIIGAFEMTTSRGDPKQLENGRDRIVMALQGLLFVLFSVVLLKIIGVDILGLNQIPFLKDIIKV